MFAAKDERPFGWQINVACGAPQRVESHKIENAGVCWSHEQGVGQEYSISAYPYRHLTGIFPGIKYDSFGSGMIENNCVDHGCRPNSDFRSESGINGNETGLY